MAFHLLSASLLFLTHTSHETTVITKCSLVTVAQRIWTSCSGYVTRDNKRSEMLPLKSSPPNSVRDSDSSTPHTPSCEMINHGYCKVL